ncbi:hypothetical protein PoB_003280400 [Plakobranchus ocellatus]|uniref:CCHC-type domain-containing protein n=1 Tax=Plakobranchus ocellatus TaxID=259542 RepID=A0AAV4AJ85_9GAST|nr:hypothetical protein PoB_003280400 [Plakobranchus ocellatus]
MNSREESQVVNVLESLRRDEKSALCFKCQKYGHITRDCTYPNLSGKRDCAGVIAMVLSIVSTKDSAASVGPTLEVTNNPQSEIRDGMLQRTSGKAVQVVANSAVLGDASRTEISVCLF